MKKHKNLIIVLILILIPVTLAVVYNVKKYTKPASKGIFYKVEKNGKYLYLGGTIHIGKDGEFIKFSKSVENAYKESSALGVEDDITDTKSIAKYEKDTTYSNGDNLYKHISPSAKKHIEPIMKNFNLKLDTYKNDTLGYLNSVIITNELSHCNFNNKGIDYYFIQKAKINKKKIISLENADIQANAVNAGDDYQNYQLENISYDDAAAKKTYDATYTAIVNGNVSYLEKMDYGRNSKNKFIKDNYNIMILQRNINMCNKIEHYLKSGKKYFIVVGTGHVLGPDGLVKMLKSKGYKVTRL